jgi:hypothetical protein
MLFKTTAEVLEFTDVLTSVKLSDVTSTIKYIEQKVVKPLLGKDLYDELSEAYKNETTDAPLTDELAELLLYCREVIGPFICYNYHPKAAIQLSAAGSQRTEGDKTKSSFAYQDAAFKEQHLLEGEAACERLLEYLFENVNSFESFKNSAEYKESQELFITSPVEFNKHYTTQQPYKNYWAMRFKMVEVETLTIKKAIGKELYAYLKEKQQEEGYEFTEEEKNLLLFIKKAISFLTISTALPHINVTINGNEISVVSDSSGGIIDKTKRKQPDNKQLDWLINSCNASGVRWLNEAIMFITDNADTLSAWQAPTAATIAKSNNDVLKGSFGMV